MAAVAPALLLDTHVVLWLAADEVSRFPPRARERIEHAQALLLSPPVLLEIAYLAEVGRVGVGGAEVFEQLNATIGLRLDDPRLHAVVRAAADQSWTRDPFDRMISAHALVRRTPLLTKDRTIRAALPLACWDER